MQYRGTCRTVTKQQMIQAPNELPEQATVEDAMDRLYLLWKITRGMEQADRGETVSHAVAMERMREWLK